jgi:uncharacterized protein
MNLLLNSTSGFNIHSYEPGKIVIAENAINERKEYTESLIISPNKIQAKWPIQEFSELRREDFKKLLEFEPEVILLGTGKNILFPPAAMLVDIYAARIGIETMTTDAACRTYTILSSDNRKVVAALII